MKYKGYDIRITHDEFNESPRSWDNLGTMVCKHKRYFLGDNQESDKIPWKEFESWSEIEEYIVNKYDVAIILPIYMYDHSGITINTTGFSCGWDSGQVGFIFISKEKVRKEYSVKRISPKLLERVKGYLIGEVATYDQHLSGEVYCYEIFDSKENLIDSCGGYYGYDYTLKECQAYVDKLPSCNGVDFINKIDVDTLKMLSVS